MKAACWSDWTFFIFSLKASKLKLVETYSSLLNCSYLLNSSTSLIKMLTIGDVTSCSNTYLSRWDGYNLSLRETLSIWVSNSKRGSFFLRDSRWQKMKERRRRTSSSRGSVCWRSSQRHLSLWRRPLATSSNTLISNSLKRGSCNSTLRTYLFPWRLYSGRSMTSHRTTLSMALRYWSRTCRLARVRCAGRRKWKISRWSTKGT